MKTVKFYTIGCKVNQYETQAIREQFMRAGFKELENAHPADIYIINTCTVTHKADRDSRYFIGLAYRQNPRAKIVVTGCYTELDNEEVSKIPGVTHIIKNQDKTRIVHLFNEITTAGSPERSRGTSQRDNDRRESRAQSRDESTNIGISSFKGHTRAFLKIQDGCDNFCSYCIVPQVRGSSRSRDLSQIIQEAKALVKNCFKEIVLTGVCLGAYGRDFRPQISLVDVIGELEKIDGLLRIRLSSIEVGAVTDKLINKISRSKKLCRHLHIPIQSGDDGILKKMNRRYTRAGYLNLIKKIKTKIPLIAITTDVIVGFPGETEKNFLNTVKLIKKILPLKVHIFPYSARKGTAAAGLKQEIGERVIKQRLEYLKKVSEDCAFEYKKQFLGKKREVLIEERVKKDNTFWVGYTDNYLKVAVRTNIDLKNQLITLKLHKIDKYCITAEL